MPKQVIDDFLNFLCESDEEVFDGTYYPKRPKTPKDKGYGFTYDLVDATDKAYAKLMDVVKTDRATLTIKTNDTCGFAIGGYIATQDGEFWQINNIQTKHNDDNKHSLRFFNMAVHTEYVLRLISVENPMELK